MRIGIFGGTFDPIHYGHLLLAETCREQCRLDEVWFLPAAVPPHKQGESLTSASQRVEMLELGISGHPAFRVSDIEIERGGLSYTVETLAAINSQMPNAELFFLMGADSLRDFPTWREPQRICELAIPVVVSRRNAPAPEFSRFEQFVSNDRLAEIRRHRVEMPIVEFSSTAIRESVHAGRSIRYQTPRAVEIYIHNHKLYQELPESPSQASDSVT